MENVENLYSLSTTTQIIAPQSHPFFLNSISYQLGRNCLHLSFHFDPPPLGGICSSHMIFAQLHRLKTALFLFGSAAGLLVVSCRADPSSLSNVVIEVRSNILANFVPKVPGLSVAFGHDGRIIWSEGFGFAHLQPGFPSRASLHALFTSQETKDGTRTGYGIGWGIKKDKQGRPIWSHGGGSVAGTSILYEENPRR
jgi:CubicO group peptidase (beta-lactamase class C family)